MLLGAGGARAATYTQVTMGGYQSCGLVNDGTVQCWGRNSSGQLGNGTTTDSSTPVAVLNSAGTAPLSGVTAISAGLTSTCALLGNQTVQCWGDNEFGQLGNSAIIGTGNAANIGTATGANNVLPAPVTGLSGVVAIGAGYNHTCALLGGGAVWCWGDNEFGQLGNSANSGATTPNPVPIQVTGLTGVTALGVGAFSNCALAGGTVSCWGSHSFGKLGDGSPPDGVPHPSPVNTGLTNVSAITVGTHHACALLDDSSLWCWGLNGNGQLGNNSGTPTSTSTPVAADLSGLPATVTAIDAGYLHTCARLSDGSAYCWGQNQYGALGNSANFGSAAAANPAPLAVTGLTNVAAPTAANPTPISAGSYTTCALLGDGSIYCWGYNGQGELGDGTTANSGAPVKIFPSQPTSSTPVPANITTGTDYGPGNPLVALTSTASAPVTWALSGGALPDGLALNADGTVTGTVTTPGAYTFSITATDGNGQTSAPVTFSTTVSNAPPVIPALGSMAPPMVGHGYTQTIPVVGGGPLTCAFTGAPPPGLTIASNAAGTACVISGAPAQAGVFNFGVTVDNGLAPATTLPMTLTVGAGGAAAVPTLGPWSLIALMLLLAGMMALTPRVWPRKG